jgi:hypothetical protein
LGAKPTLALPQLRGRALAAFRLVWLALAALAIVATLVGAWQSDAYYERLSKPFIDLGLRTGAGVTLGVPLGSAARTSGIARGSVVLAIDGKPLPADAGVREMRERLRAVPGPTVSLRTRAPDGTLREHLLTRSPAHITEAYVGTGMTHAQRRAFEVLLGLAAALVMFSAASLLFARRAADPVAALLSLSFLCLCIGSGPALDFFSAGHESSEVSLVFRAVGFCAFFLAVSVFPHGRLEPRWSAWLLIPIGLWGVADLMWALGWRTYPGLLDITGTALFIASFAAMAARYRALPQGVERQQIRWVFLGFAAGLVMALVVLGITMTLPSIEVDRWRILLWLGMMSAWNGGLCAVALGLLVSLLRYRLYDADAVISRSATYAALTLILAGTFAASAQAVEWIMQKNFGGDAGALPGAIAAGLAVMLFTPMHRRVQDWAERRFQKGLLHLRRDLPDHVRELRETASMAELLDDVLARIESGVHASSLAVVVDGAVVAARGTDPGALDPDAFPLSVPVRLGQGEPIGTLLVGPRPDGRPVGKDEREALEEIADPIARAIRIVRLRERREIEAANALTQLRDDLGERMSAIESLMREKVRGSHRDMPDVSL